MADYIDKFFTNVKGRKSKRGSADEPQTEKAHENLKDQTEHEEEKPRPQERTAQKHVESPGGQDIKSMVEGTKPPSSKISERPHSAPIPKTGTKTLDEVTRKILETPQGMPAMKKDLAPQKENPDEPLVSKTEIEMEHRDKMQIDAYGNVKIYRIPENPLLYYWTPVVRPGSGERAIINTIKEAATRIVSITPYKVRDQEQRRNVYFQRVLEIIKNSPELNIPKSKYEFYADAVVREMVGFGLIDALINDDKLEEIMVIGPNLPVYVFHRQYEMMVTNIEFFSDGEIQDVINRIARLVGRRVDIASPLLDARLADGSRVNATIPPATVEGSTLTIRKFKEDPYTILDLVKTKTLNYEAAAFLWLCTEGLGTRPANILIAGGTGSGKTTLLNILASFVPDRERVITIEDTAELNLPLKHWIRMEARPPGLEGTGELTLDILTKNSLRMRPDRIIVGEIRHDEAFALFTAMNTGHDGSLGTVHSNSPQETVIRVTSPPMNVPDVMLSGLNFIVIIHRLHDKRIGTIRRVTEIAEVTGALRGKPKTNTIYKWEAASDTLKRTDEPLEYMILLEDMTGMSKKQLDDEIDNRADFLKKLVDEKVTGIGNVSERMKSYILAKSKRG